MTQPLMVTHALLPPAQAEALYDEALYGAALNTERPTPPELAAWPGEDWNGEDWNGEDWNDPPKPLPSPLPRPPKSLPAA